MKQIQKDEKIVVVRYFVVKKNEKKKVIGAFMVFNDFDEMDACRQQLRKRHRCDQIDMDWKIIAASSVIIVHNTCYVPFGITKHRTINLQ